jgi:hypothetical protein
MSGEVIKCCAPMPIPNWALSIRYTVSPLANPFSRSHHLRAGLLD